MIQIILIVVVGSIYVFLGVVWLMLRTRLPEDQRDQFRIPTYEEEANRETTPPSGKTIA
jgi:hypothetical protein